MTTITVTNLYTHKGGNLIFAGIISDGQVMDKGWSKHESGEIMEIRKMENMNQRVPTAGPEKEYLFMCSHVFKKIYDGDELTVQ